MRCLLLVLGIVFLSIVFSLNGVVAISSCTDGINLSGVYNLTTNISSNDSCLTVNASNVVVDCNGYYINFGGDGGSSHSAVYINGGFSNVTIRNCNIVKNGTDGSFYYGVDARNEGYNHSIINNNFTIQGENYIYAILFNASSNNLTIRDNVISPGVNASAWLGIDNGAGVFNIYNNVINSTSNWFEWNGAAALQNYTNISFSSINGIVRLNNFSINGTVVLNYTSLNISNSAVFLNSTRFPQLNGSAEITIYNSTGNNLLIDYDSNGSFVNCPALICTLISHSNVTNITIFNVTHWTTYSTNSTVVAVNTTTVSEDTSTSSGTTITSFWSLERSITDAEFNEGVTKEQRVKERMKITINDEIHYVGVVAMTATSATINVSSTPQQAVFNIGDLKKFDVDADDYYDLSIKLESITNGKANMTVKSINEVVVVVGGDVGDDADSGVGAEEEGDEIISDAQFSFGNLLWISIIIIVLLLVGIIIYYFIKSKNSKGKGVKNIFSKITSSN